MIVSGREKVNLFVDLVYTGFMVEYQVKLSFVDDVFTERKKKKVLGCFLSSM